MYRENLVFKVTMLGDADGSDIVKYVKCLPQPGVYLIPQTEHL